MIYCLSLVQHNNYFLLQKMLWEQALDILLSGTGMCNASLMKVMRLFCILFKVLLDKNYCRKMQSVWGWTSARWVNYPWQRNIKKYIVQTFEPRVKQRFAPKLAVCYWLYNVNLIKNPKLFIILVWRGGPTSSERGSSIAKSWWSCPLLWASHMESL